jgi:hypothetical protein
MVATVVRNGGQTVVVGSSRRRSSAWNWPEIGPEGRENSRVTAICAGRQAACQDHVELRGFEPLTFCMPYKFLSFRNAAACGSNCKFDRLTSPVKAEYCSSLAPVLLPCRAVSGILRTCGLSLVPRVVVSASHPAGRVSAAASTILTASPLL